MYRIPTNGEIANMESNFPLIVLHDKELSNKFQSYTIVRKYAPKTRTCFFRFEGRKDNDIISVFQLVNGEDAITGNDTWDDTNRILAIEALKKWAIDKGAKEIIVHTHNRELFEVLWDDDFTNFDLGPNTSDTFCACGIKKF